MKKNSEILAEFPKIHPFYRGDLDGRSVHFEDADVDSWQRLGTGGERLTCFSPLFPEGCVKLSSRYCCPQTVREVDYLNYLKKKGVTASFMPKFLGSLSSPSYVGLAVEAVLPTPEQRVWGLGSYLVEIGAAEESVWTRLEDAIRATKREMHARGVVVSDIGTNNMFILEKTGQLRIVIIDGYYIPEHIPTAKYIPWFRNLKINRQWAKFARRYQKATGRTISFE